MDAHAQTSSHRPGFLDGLRQRGMLKDCSDLEGLARLMDGGPVTAYCGFDATAPGLHAGHLVALLTMRRLAEAGHRVLALVGGATTLVGDPSFRTEGRPMMDEAAAAANAEAVRGDIRRVLAPVMDRVTFVDNADWLGGAGLLEFMREVGSRFTVARMSAMESMRGRLEKGLPVTMMEFSYMMMQAADFLELSRREGCLLQIGGSDQWGNICNGIDLARRTDGRELFGLTVPLLVDSAGRKMGKTAAGAVWLSPERLSPEGFWQFWRNVPDADAGRFLSMFTDLPRQEREALAALEGEGLNRAKERLADEVTAAVHGEGAALKARAEARQLFGEGGSPEGCAMEVAADASGKTGLLAAMSASGLSRTNGEARRLVLQGAVRLDGERVENPALALAARETPYLIAAGRKRRALVRVTAS